MNSSAVTAATAIIAHYQKEGVSITAACVSAADDMRGICNSKTLYHISRGQKASPRVEYALQQLQKTIPPVPKPDTRPFPIRITFPANVDGHEARSLILEKLTPLERGGVLLERARRRDCENTR